MKHTHHTQSGFTVLISVLMVGGVAISVGLSLVMFGVRSLQNAGITEMSIRSRMLTHTCIEHALKDIQSTEGTTTGGSAVFDNVTCTYAVTDLGDEKRRIVASTTVDTSYSQLTVEIDTFSEQITISSWEE